MLAVPLLQTRVLRYLVAGLYSDLNLNEKAVNPHSQNPRNPSSDHESQSARFYPAFLNIFFHRDSFSVPDSVAVVVVENELVAWRGDSPRERTAASNV